MTDLTHLNSTESSHPDIPADAAATPPSPPDDAAPAMAFAQLQLADKLARAVAEMGYERMTPIQAQACLFYTTDAADENRGVYPSCRGILKKKIKDNSKTA